VGLALVLVLVLGLALAPGLGLGLALALGLGLLLALLLALALGLRLALALGLGLRRKPQYCTERAISASACSSTYLVWELFEFVVEERGGPRSVAHEHADLVVRSAGFQLLLQRGRVGSLNAPRRETLARNGAISPNHQSRRKKKSFFSLSPMCTRTLGG
jgi:hypothetical protein